MLSLKLPLSELKRVAEGAAGDQALSMVVIVCMVVCGVMLMRLSAIFGTLM